MPPLPHVSPEERDALLREARSDSWGTRIPIRAAKEGAPGESTGAGAGTRLPPPQRKLVPQGGSRRRLRTVLWILAVLLVGALFGAGKLLSVGSAVLSQERSLIGQLTDLLFRRGALLGEKENRINILLAAIGGEGHQGENLADTIILASIQPQEKDVAMLSIPRDLYVKIPSTELYARINNVHAYGENQRRGEGVKLLREKVAEITGQPVHYVVRVDFEAFKRIVDQIGGVDITIHNSFYDFWHKISFPAGTEHMNGERALAYVRARYIEGPEGGDFKRAERTQQIALAIRKKIFSVETAVDLRALAGVLDALRDHVVTNFTLAELRRLAELTRDIPDDRLHTAVLTTGPEGLLQGTTEVLGGRPASVLRPRAGLEHYAEIQKFAANIFSEARVAPSPASASVPPAGGPATPTPSPSPTALPSPGGILSEQPTVDVRNGTTVTGLAARAAKVLEKHKFTITTVGNAAIRNRTQTIVVDWTNGKKPASLQKLLATLGVTTAVAFPEAEKKSADADLIVFLGTDVVETFK
ncbi:MAG: putative LytR family transcriptional protein [Parcubacteria group bacterium Gr01-1014_38]|nr:MAG: putative LytR family transcriptional protein [Parcubacteria group bacterium Gr01-1014_38]